uniref:Replication protein A subunit n=1 Tax=Anas platyrhynchos TaxID=8839 RepID=A0A8B9SHW9_ANAPL
SSLRFSFSPLQAIMQGENVTKPVLQVINTRAIATGNGPPRYRVLMSDGVNTLSSFMLATQLNSLVEEERLSAQCICQVNRFIVNSLKDGRRVVILMDLDYHAPSNQFSKASAPILMVCGPFAARVTQKGQIRTWSNSRGEGKLFSIELVDESGEIRATAFNDQADKFFPLIELNKVYYFTKGNLKTANKQYTAVKNDYEITFTNETSVVLCDDAQHLPSVRFEFVSISELENTPKDSIVDVIGICKSYEDVTKITVKASNREVSKRNVHLMDTSGKLVTATLWGNEADTFDGSRQPVVAIKGARVSDFGGRSLSVLSSSTVVVNPDTPEAFKLRGWFDSEGQLLECSSISDVRGSAPGVNTNWKTLYEVKAENLGQGDKADYFSCVGTVVHLRKENCMYQACPSQDCNKKVIDQQNGLYRCEKCDREFPNFKYRMMLLVTIADCLEYQWVTCFQDTAEFILGQSAAFLGELKEKNEQAFEEVFQNANFNTYEFRIRVKLETYNDESRIKATAMDVKPVNYREYSKRLIANIRRNAQLG